MMTVFINSLTGTEMLVSDDRKDEYLAAGHKLAAESIGIDKPIEEKSKKVGRKPSKKR